MAPLRLIYGFFQDYAIIAVVVVFALMGLWAYWPSNKERLQRHASIPLEDGA
jgi:cbb3-type cytochrome oxidase subunit 3